MPCCCKGCFIVKLELENIASARLVARSLVSCPPSEDRGQFLYAIPVQQGKTTILSNIVCRLDLIMHLYQSIKFFNKHGSFQGGLTFLLFRKLNSSWTSWLCYSLWLSLPSVKGLMWTCRGVLSPRWGVGIGYCKEATLGLWAAQTRLSRRTRTKPSRK